MISKTLKGLDIPCTPRPIKMKGSVMQNRADMVSYLPVNGLAWVYMKEARGIWGESEFSDYG
jgi:hypothetical protein